MGAYQASRPKFELPEMADADFFLKIGILQSAASVGAFLGPVTGGLLYGFSRLGRTKRDVVQFWMWSVSQESVSVRGCISVCLSNWLA